MLDTCAATMNHYFPGINAQVKDDKVVWIEQGPMRQRQIQTFYEGYVDGYTNPAKALNDRKPIL
jgi:hypothetical protein